MKSFIQTLKDKIEAEKALNGQSLHLKYLITKHNDHCDYMQWCRDNKVSIN